MSEAETRNRSGERAEKHHPVIPGLFAAPSRTEPGIQLFDIAKSWIPDRRWRGVRNDEGVFRGNLRCSRITSI
jgi:hypothetical protein